MHYDLLYRQVLALWSKGEALRFLSGPTLRSLFDGNSKPLDDYDPPILVELIICLSHTKKNKRSILIIATKSVPRQDN